MRCGIFKTNRISGFTLVEVMVAAVTLALVVAVMLRAFASINSLNRPGKSVSTNLSRAYVEQLNQSVRGSQWDQPNFPLSVPSTSTAVVTQGGVQYNRTTTVSTVPGKDYRKVRVVYDGPS